uniref:Uncharacterized protein n=1 Tax=Oryza sativa subsp. japonica TaxID=39947 RepID=Q6ZDE2_ORYSJ|nr:hypothetical protein [Oryza sativa Japonica Group]
MLTIKKANGKRQRGGWRPEAAAVAERQVVVVVVVRRMMPIEGFRCCSRPPMRGMGATFNPSPVAPNREIERGDRELLCPSLSNAARWRLPARIHLLLPALLNHPIALRFVQATKPYKTSPLPIPPHTAAPQRKRILRRLRHRRRHPSAPSPDLAGWLEGVNGADEAPRPASSLTSLLEPSKTRCSRPVVFLVSSNYSPQDLPPQARYAPATNAGSPPSSVPTALALPPMPRCH